MIEETISCLGVTDVFEELTLENLSHSSEANVKQLFDDGHVDGPEMHTILDPNGDLRCDLTDLAWHNQRLQEDRRIRWEGLAGLFGHAPSDLVLKDSVDPGQLTGHIVNIRQAHSTLEMANAYATARNFAVQNRQSSVKRVVIESDQATGVKLVKDSQERIYRYLKSVGARHIFSETQLRETFVKGGKIEVGHTSELHYLSAQQIKMEFGMGRFAYMLYPGALRYASENPDATLYKVIEPAIQAYVEEQLHLLENQYKAKEISLEEKESVWSGLKKMRDEIMRDRAFKFLAENPGEKIYIVMGKGHVFPEGFFGKGISLETQNFGGREGLTYGPR